MPRVSIGRAELETRPHILYRFYDRTGVLLYIGITVDFAERMTKHAREKSWWADVDRSATTVEYYDSRSTARRAETAAIKAEKPLENDQHNEWVDIDDERDWLDEPYIADDFARTILDCIDQQELELVTEDHLHEADGSVRTDRGQRLAAAYFVLTEMIWDRRVLPKWISMLQTATQMAGDIRWKAYLAEIEGQHRRYESVLSDLDKAKAFIEALTAAKSADYLNTLPAGEGDGWRRAIRAVVEPCTATGSIEVQAAAYADNYKSKGWIRKGLCAGPDVSGARCHRTDTVMTTFEICPLCTDGSECTGHDIWCAGHEADARAGRLSLIDQGRVAWFPIRPRVSTEAAA